MLVSVSLWPWTRQAGQGGQLHTANPIPQSELAGGEQRGVSWGRRVCSPAVEGPGDPSKPWDDCPGCSLKEEEA